MDKFYKNMKFNEFYVSSTDGKSNCVIRSFCKILNLNYDVIYDELCNIQRKMKADSYNDINVFEAFMSRHDIESIEYGKGMQIKKLELDEGSYIVFCWNKEDFYHMITIIDNTIYDKENECMELYVINLYKKRNL